MPRISIIGVRTGHLVNARPASPLCISFDLEGPIAISRPIPSWVDCITSIGVLPDGLYFCAPQVVGNLLAAVEVSLFDLRQRAVRISARNSLTLPNKWGLLRSAPLLADGERRRRCIEGRPPVAVWIDCGMPVRSFSCEKRHSKNLAPQDAPRTTEKSHRFSRSRRRLA